MEWIKDWFLGKKVQCPLCDEMVRKADRLVKYFALNEEGEQEMFEMKICDGCAEVLEEATKGPPPRTVQPKEKKS